MAKSQPIKYSGQYGDTLAMPGSQLHEHLTKGDKKAAKRSYLETEARYRKLVGEEQMNDQSTGEVDNQDSQRDRDAPEYTPSGEV